MKNHIQLPKDLGSFTLGPETVTLEVREGTGGTLTTCDTEKLRGRISVGLDSDDFDEVVATMLHEVIEYSIIRVGGRLQPADSWGNDQSEYVFVLTHPQFSDVLSKSTPFIRASLLALHTAWQARKRMLANQKTK